MAERRRENISPRPRGHRELACWRRQEWCQRSGLERPPVPIPLSMGIVIESFAPWPPLLFPAPSVPGSTVRHGAKNRNIFDSAGSGQWRWRGRTQLVMKTQQVGTRKHSPMRPRIQIGGTCRCSRHRPIATTSERTWSVPRLPTAHYAARLTGLEQVCAARATELSARCTPCSHCGAGSLLVNIVIRTQLISSHVPVTIRKSSYVRGTKTWRAAWS